MARRRTPWWARAVRHMAQMQATRDRLAAALWELRRLRRGRA